MWELDSPLASRPLVSIVTPCFNAAQFIEETIQSVLAQDYSRIEYIVMDGGSTDGTLDLLKPYQGGLRLLTQRDRGAADAINRGFSLAHGDIFAFLNADDLYLPGAVSTAVRAFQADPKAAAVYGDAWWTTESGEHIGPYPVRDFDRDLLGHECFICQPAAFMRREAFENAGGMDPELHWTFDYELWMRLTRIYEMRRIAGRLASSRMHRANKTLGNRREVFRETFRIMRRHYGYIPFSWIYAYVSNRADGHDQFFEPLRPSMLRYLESLPIGLFMNRRKTGHYLAEWFGVMSWAGFLRRLKHE